MPVKRSIIPLHVQYSYTYTWRSSPCFYPPLASPCSPFVSPLTYLAPSSCDRNRPPQSQVACKLTPFAPPFTQPTPPLQFPEPQLPSALLRRPREYSGSCYPEQLWHCGELATPLLTVKPVGVYSTTLVQYLYISCYLLDNKPVLSYLFSRLLPQWWPRSGCTLCIVHCTVVHSHSHVGSPQR